MLLTNNLKRLNVKKVGIVNKLDCLLSSTYHHHQLESLKFAQLKPILCTDENIKSYNSFLSNHSAIYKLSNKIFEGLNSQSFGAMIANHPNTEHLKIEFEAPPSQTAITDLLKPISRLTVLKKMCSNAFM